MKNDINSIKYRYREHYKKLIVCNEEYNIPFPVYFDAEWRKICSKLKGENNVKKNNSIFKN